MKLIYLDKELDNTKEHELFSNNKFGFLVEIEYTDNSWYPNKKQEIHNVTEVHYKYDTYGDDERIAFESDILQTGCNRNISDIEVIKITKDINYNN